LECITSSDQNRHPIEDFWGGPCEGVLAARPFSCGDGIAEPGFGWF
jgi:hypothetical protein